MPRVVGSHGIYKKASCVWMKHTNFTPQQHQKDTMNYFLKSPYKGLLLYHKLGSGKTCTSVMIADRMLRERKIRRVFILSPGSLRDGWINEYCTVCGYKIKYLKKYFTFLTYNYHIGKRLPDFTNSLVIIDEVHNIINGIKNRSETSVSIYKALTESNCRILALSGTPIFNYVYEWSLLGNLLKPGTFPNVVTQKGEIDSFAFMKLFNVQENGELIPIIPTRMKRDLEGIVSYYPGRQDGTYPTVINMDPIKALMPPEQEKEYWIKYIQEKQMNKPPSKSLEKNNKELFDLITRLYIMTRKHVLTRGTSNFFYLPEYVDMKDKLRKNGGWVRKKAFRGDLLVKIFSMKFALFFMNLILHNKQKHILFTFFKTKSGVILLHSMLKMCGIKSLIFSGDLNDQKRRRILKDFNSPSNKHGDVIRILLITEAGAEGITVKHVRHIHILESSSRETKIQQAIGRVVRYNSHSDLPKRERDVRVWRYWSIASELPIEISSEVYNNEGEKKVTTEVIKDKKTIDVILYEKGQKTLRKIHSFLRLLQSVSVTKF